jgi:hypothetical protein
VLRRRRAGDVVVGIHGRSAGGKRKRGLGRDGAAEAAAACRVDGEERGATRRSNQARENIGVGASNWHK